MPEAILTILKFCFLALLYLFLLRVVRVVYVELGGRTRDTRRATTGAQPAVAPQRSSRGKKALALRVVDPEENRGRTYPIGDEITVGRAATCNVSLNDDTYVSQLHARVFVRDGELYVEDLGSTNGTYLNRKRLTYAMPVKRGDQIQIGKTILEVTR